MKMSEFIKHRISGEPRLRHSGGDVRITASHRLPNSGHEHVIALWTMGTIGATALLVRYYRPEIANDPEANFILENTAILVMALSNAFAALTSVAHSDGQAVPLEALRGWMLAVSLLLGAFLFRLTGLHDLLMWLGNRERMTIVVGDEQLSVRHGTFRFPKRIRLDDIEDVLILANHRKGNDVVLQHEGGLTRLASVYGDLTRPTLIKRCVERAIGDASGSIRTKGDRRGSLRTETA